MVLNDPNEIYRRIKEKKKGVHIDRRICERICNIEHTLMVKNLRDLSKVIWNLLDELLTKGETKVLFGDEFVFSNCF